jgi:hypothetical protein
MRKFMKVLGFLSVLATVSDISGLAKFSSLFSNEDMTLNDMADVASDDVVSEDYRPSVKKTRRPKRPEKVEEKPRAKDSPQPSLSSNSTLFTDIVANRELFIRFDFDRHAGNTLCAVNREVGTDAIGLLLLEPSGILESLIIDRNTLAVIHKKASIPRKELRDELANNGVLVSDARLIASQVAEVRKSDPGAIEKIDTEKTGEKSSPRKIRTNEALWTKVREEVKNSKTPELSPAESREILERFRKEIQKFNSNPKQEAVTEK